MEFMIVAMGVLLLVGLGCLAVCLSGFLEAESYTQKKNEEFDKEKRVVSAVNRTKLAARGTSKRTGGETSKNYESDCDDVFAVMPIIPVDDGGDVFAVVPIIIPVDDGDDAPVKAEADDVNPAKHENLVPETQHTPTHDPTPEVTPDTWHSHSSSIGDSHDSGSSQSHSSDYSSHDSSSYSDSSSYGSDCGGSSDCGGGCDGGGGCD